ncbi:hypothetical protein Pfo_027272 [Paulownia fortunei]|nr:hypothetical protein Pfo_027272 [Paulownia fortunei]
MPAKHVKTLPAPRFMIAESTSNSPVQSRVRRRSRDFMQRGSVRVLLKREDGPSATRPFLRGTTNASCCGLIPRDPG